MRCRHSYDIQSRYSAENLEDNTAEPAGRFRTVQPVVDKRPIPTVVYWTDATSDTSDVSVALHLRLVLRFNDPELLAEIGKYPLRVPVLRAINHNLLEQIMLVPATYNRLVQLTLCIALRFFRFPQ